MKINLFEVRKLIRKDIVTKLVKESVESFILLEQSNLSYKNNAEILSRYQEGDPSALGELITANQGLVRKIAHRYKNTGVPFEDLEAAGYEGLIRAINKLSVGAGNEEILKNMSNWTRSMMQKEIESLKPVKVGGRQERTIKSGFTKAFNRLKAELGRDPSDEEIADELGVSVERLKSVRRVGAVSTSSPLGDEGEATFGDTLTYSDQGSPEELYMRKEFEELINRFENSLVDYKDIMAFKAGLKKEMTLEKAAEMIRDELGLDNFTRAAVSARAKNLERKLKSFIEEEGYYEVDDDLSFFEKSQVA